MADSLTITPAPVKTLDYNTEYDRLMTKKRALDREYYAIMTAMIKGADDKEAAYNLVLKQLVDVENEIAELQVKGVPDVHYVVFGSIPTRVDRQPIKVAEDKTERAKANANASSSKHKKPLSPEQKAKLLALNAKALAKAGFKFANLKECVSQARTKPFYMAKEDLIKTIERDAELRKKMPAKYKAMKKDVICEALLS